MKFYILIKDSNTTHYFVDEMTRISEMLNHPFEMTRIADMLKHPFEMTRIADMLKHPFEMTLNPANQKVKSYFPEYLNKYFIYLFLIFYS